MSKETFREWTLKNNTIEWEKYDTECNHCGFNCLPGEDLLEDLEKRVWDHQQSKIEAIKKFALNNWINLKMWERMEMELEG